MSINKFDNSIFTGALDLAHLNFDNSFSIDLDRNSIIFGFNAIGKTSISKFLSSHYPEQFYLINYENEKDDIKAVKAGKKIELKPDYHKLNVAKDELNRAKQSVDLFTRIERFTGLQKTKINANTPEYFLNAKKNESIEKLEITSEQFVEIDEILRPVKLLFGTNIDGIIKNSSTLEEESKNMQLSVVKKFSTDYFRVLQENEDQNVCPICHQKLDDPVHSLREILESNISNLSHVLEPYFTDYLVNKTKEENSAFLRSVSSLITRYSGNEKIFYEYLMIDSVEDLADLNSKIDEQNEKEENVKTEESAVATLAANLEANEEISREFYLNNFQFKDVKYDKKKKSLVLTLPDDRDASTYSQGELNLITLASMLINASSTDKQNIIIDDPLSSHDIPNQYIIMYKIVKFIREHNAKIVTIFTHNPDALNIGHQYEFGCNFDYVYIEKFNSYLYTIKLAMNKNIINLDDIISIDSDHYLMANRDREDPLYNDSATPQKDLDEIFHFDLNDVTIPYKGCSFSNKFLYEKITTFCSTSITLGNFEENTLNKVYYLMALRVFIEKKFAEISEDIKNDLNGTQFGNKLTLIQNNYLVETKAKYPNFDIDKLKEMKVMLNQNEHFNSQVQPYYYAINLSLDDINEQIFVIKNMFN